jgi:aminoglycoside 3-N-acetyltransferase
MIRRLKKLVKHLLRMCRQPWLKRQRLVAELQRLGVRRGGVLLVHSSLSSLGFVPGGPAAVIAALRDALGPEGTLMMPAHTWEWMNRGLRVFDARSTPGCVGVIAEVFRRMGGVLRSLHPTHSVSAAGPRAAEMIEGHETAETPCGAGTPYARLLEADGQILLLGATLDSNTAFHCMEALCGYPDLLRAEHEEFEIIDLDGTSRRLRVSQQREGIARRYRAMREPLVQAGAAVAGHAGGAELFLMHGARFQAVVSEWLRNDPCHLVEKRLA